jgi:hypothetical protein
MNKLFTLLSVLALATPAAATPNRFAIVNPNEPMVVVPGLEQLGPSRISTVQHCQVIEGVKDWQNLITDSDFEQMSACLVEHT